MIDVNAVSQLDDAAKLEQLKKLRTEMEGMLEYYRTVIQETHRHHVGDWSEAALRHAIETAGTLKGWSLEENLDVTLDDSGTFYCYVTVPLSKHYTLDETVDRKVLAVTSRRTVGLARLNDMFSHVRAEGNFDMTYLDRIPKIEKAS